MKRISIYLRLSIIIVFACLLPMETFAEKVEIDGIYYNLNLSQAYASVLSGPDKYKGNVNIPENITYSGNNYKVKIIGNYAFQDCQDLTSVTIPNSVTVIGEKAFHGCSGLTSVTLNSNTILSETYTSSSNLSSIFGSQVNKYIIGNSVTSIGSYAFSNCSALVSVTIGNSVTSIGSYAFYGCLGLTSVTIPNSVTRIGSHAFKNCSALTSASIGNGVKIIDDYAFHGCSGLVSITIGNGVTYIGGYVFHGCSILTSVSLNCNSIISKSFASSSSISTIFGTQVKSYILGDKITSIGNFAFRDCSELTSVTISNSVTSIGSHAFQNCSELNKVIVPDIAKWYSISFGSSDANPLTYAHHLYSDENTEIKELIIPNSVTKISSYAFSGCSSLVSVTIPNSVRSIDISAFSECSGLNKVIVPDIAKWYSISFGSSDANPLTYAHHLYSDENTEIKELIIPNSVTKISSYAFSGCSGLASVTIPNSVRSIDISAFSECSGLTSVTINSNSIVSANYPSYSSISNFFGSQVKSYILGDQINSIGSYFFYGCSELTSITIGNSVTSIGEYAFQDCSGLTSITIPNSVTSIGYGAFQNCSGLKKVIVSDIAKWCSISFGTSDANPLTYAHHLYSDENTEIKELIIPNSVTMISSSAFSGCSGLASATIGNGVTNIEEYAFSGCSGLTSVTLNSNSIVSKNYTSSSSIKNFLVRK